MHNAYTRLLRSAACTAAMMIFAAPAMAQLTPAQQQAVDIQTGTASPGRDDGRFFGEEFTPRVTPRVEVQKLQIQGAPPGAENIKFQLGGINFDGATVYSPEQLRSVYGEKIGSTITLADLYMIAADITRMYRNEGYILTQVVVPPQTIDGGIARLQVVEGYIDQIEVRGPEDAALGLVRRYAAHIKKNAALNNVDLERALLLINDLAGVDARGVLNPSKTQAGAADLVVIVERKPYDGQLGIDNFGTKFLGPLQLSAAGSLNSWLHRNERITAQFVGAPGPDRYQELLHGSLGYEEPVWDNGTMLQLLGTYTHTTPGASLDQFDVRGYSTYLSAQLEHPFVRSRSFNLSGRVQFDHRNVRTRNNIPVDVTREDKISALRVGGRLETLDDFLGLAFNTVDVELAHGLDILGAKEEGTLSVTRPNADPTFFKLNAEIQRLQRITSELNLLLGVTGQLANDALLSSEEFGLGGINYGRGYDPSEVIGDDGLAGKVELQWNEPYEFSELQSYQLYTFYDAGRVWNEDSTTSGGEKETLTSAGFGIRADFTEMTTAGLGFAFPLNNTPQATNDREPRVYVNLYHRF